QRPIAFDESLDADDLAAIFYTGGTTGPAKGVMLSHRNLVLNALQMIVGAGYDEQDVFLHAAPMFHLADASSIYALTWRGARQVILPKFDPDAALALVARERVTCTIFVPAMIAALLDRPGLASADCRSLRLILHGGAPIAADLLRRAVGAFGCSFTQAYGLTEASSHVALLPREEALLDDPRGRSTGRATLGVDVRTRRPDGAVCNPGEIGEVTVRGATITRGYWRQPAATASALRDGWFWTGDLGYLDDEGYIYLVDRAKDVIISGGENVYPREVEARLESHPSVSAAAVIGVPDPTWGERVHAVVALRPGSGASPTALQTHCKDRLAGYKCPRS
ncbi:MAG TPA: AMP-binding protein, partial [Thermomicrobiales bacterium]|nr:AMP-binding protein [Thermomicrobiales bacterium]